MAARTLYLVDASSYVYRAFFALPPLTGPSGIPTNAVYGFTTMMLKLLKDAHPALLALVFDAPGETFRDRMYADYKGNRPEMPSDLAAQWPLVQQVATAFRAHLLEIPGVEADDVIGSLARAAATARLDCVIVTSDKDLMQLVGPHVRLWDTMRDRWTDEAVVRQRFGVAPHQLVEIAGLVGDSIDNVPGVRGIGEKTACALIQHFGSIEATLERLEEIPSLSLRGAKKVAQLLRDGAAVARLSRDLTAIRDDLDCGVDPTELHYPGPDAAAMRELAQRFGFQSLLKDLPAPPPPPSPEAERLETPAEVEEMARRLAGGRDGDGRDMGDRDMGDRDMGDRWIALACIGAGTAEAASCPGVVFAGPGVEPTVVPARPEMLAPLRAVTADPSVQKLGHDLKSEIATLRRLGISLVGPFFDLMVASYVLNASPTHRLEDVCREVLGESIEIFRGAEGGAAQVAAGVRRMPQVRDAVRQRIREAGMERLFFEVEMPLVEVLAAMERRGVRLDTGGLRSMGDEWRRKLESICEDIYGMAGGEFNINSPPQLREVLFERLRLPSRGVRRGKTGGLSTDVDVLNRLAAEHPLPAKVLEYRGLAKLLSTYVDALLAAVDPADGRLHTDFRQTVAATGRLSSSNPNLQNIPIRGEEGRRIRSAFVPEPGALFIAADYSQIELRVMAHLSEDPGLRASFLAGEDIHARTAAEIFGALPGTVTADMRRVAKVINFGIMYGMGPQRLAAELGIALNAAQRYIEQYFERYQGVRAFIERTIAEGRETGYVSTMFGRRRPVPELRSRDRATAQAAERAAINMPIQGTAADLIKIAMVRVAQRLPREGLRGEMILQVHDELVLETPEDEADKATLVVREEMENAAALSVPLAVEVGSGKSWAEAH